jgi:hypothetical protein
MLRHLKQYHLAKDGILVILEELVWLHSLNLQLNRFEPYSFGKTLHLLYAWI